MVMDAGQIVREYRAAKNKGEAVKIQAQLNEVTEEEIRRILIEGGVRTEELPRSPRKKNAGPADEAAEELSRAIQALRKLADGMRLERAQLEAREKKMEEAVSGVLAELRRGRDG